MRTKYYTQENCSHRQTDQEHLIDRQTLDGLVDLAHLTTSEANKQSLKYFLCHDPDTSAEVHPLLGGAGYLKSWPGPVDDDGLVAYIIIVGDETISPEFGIDHGIAAQTILLGASKLGLAGCIIGTTRKDKLSQILGVPNELEILLVIALGKPADTVKFEAQGVTFESHDRRKAPMVHNYAGSALQGMMCH